MDREELLATARMARLQLPPQEFEKLALAVTQMLNHFAKMRELDVDHLEPTTHALHKTNRLREDQVIQEQACVILGNVPENDDNYIVIPNVL